MTNMKTNSKKLTGVKVAAGVKAGGFIIQNHNRRAASLSVKTNIKAGEVIVYANHNRRLA
jgi:hypothetical protein